MSMTIIRDEKRVARNRTISQILSFVGLGIIVTSFVIGLRDPERYFGLQIIGLAVGWIMSQVSIYMSHRYVRSPRMDEVIDKSARQAASSARMYHYVLPAPHVLLTRSGPIVLVAQYQEGGISVNEKGKWRQKRSGLRRWFGWFGQEGLGNPARDAEARVTALANFIRKNAPEVEEVPVGAVIVFTSDHATLVDVAQSPFPVVHHTKLNNFLRKNLKGKLLPKADLAALRRAFDEAAGDVLEQDSAEPAAVSGK